MGAPGAVPMGGRRVDSMRWPARVVVWVRVRVMAAVLSLLVRVQWPERARGEIEGRDGRGRGGAARRPAR